MSAEANKALARRWYAEVFSGHDLSKIEAIFSPDYEDHSTQFSSGKGTESLKQLFAGLFAAFPDLHATVGDMLAEGDRVAVRYQVSGTQQGPFMGLPPTGKAASIGAMDFIRFADGRMVEHWGEVDTLSLLQQLGASPAPGQAG